MAELIIMPKVGISVESCIITKWHKSKGDKISKGDLLFSYETDKASVDEEAKTEGVLLEILADEGEEVPVLDGVCVIGNEGEDISALAKKDEAGTTETVVPEADSVISNIAVAENDTEQFIPIATTNGDIKISPRAKRLAEKLGADARLASPTGAEGRIIESDIQKLADSGVLFTKSAQKPSSPSIIQGTGIGGRVTVNDAANPVSDSNTATNNVVKLSNIRKAISKAMMASLSGSAQLTNHSSFDATSVKAYRAGLKNSVAAGITVTDVLVYALSRTLMNHKDFNANLIDDEVYYFGSANIGVAVDTPRGLLVPTLFGADKMSLFEISDNLKELYAKVKDGSISPDLLRGGSFTISNLGSLGVEMFTPVINPPQTAILGVCSIIERIKTIEGNMNVYPAMGLSLTYDHRLIDGAPAARFVNELKENLENIPLMLSR